MNFIRHRIFIAAILFVIPAVFCATNSTQTEEKKDIFGSNFNAIDELSVTANKATQIITEVISQVQPPPENPYEMIERQSVLAELQKKVIVIKSENAQLEATKSKLKQGCDAKLEQLTEAYNTIMGSLNLDMPEMKLWERRLQTAMLTRELIIKAISEASVFVSFFELKKIVLVGDIDLLGTRQSQYPTCLEFRRLLTLEPGVPEVSGVSGVPQPGVKTGGGVKTNAIGLRSMPGADVSRTLFDRKRILLNVKLEQESHVNRELKKYIQFYAGFCSRSVDSMKRRIDDLRRYPAGEHSIDRLKNEVTVIETEVVEKRGQLGSLKEGLLRLAAEVQELQIRYDSLQEAADCFLELVRFHVDGAVALLTESIVAAEQLTYREEGEELVLNEREAITGPNGFLPQGPEDARSLTDSESVEVSGDWDDEHSHIDDLAGFDSRQQQEQVLHAAPSGSSGLKLPEEPIKIAEPGREPYLPPTLTYVHRNSGK